MALQLTGAFKREALPNLQMRAAGRRDRRRPDGDRHRDRTDGVLPAARSRRRSSTTRSLPRNSARRRPPRLRRGGARAARRVSGARPRGPCRAGARRGGGEAPDFVPLVRAWGGVTIAYRKRMVDSPAYRLNHEEVIKALEEGIAFAENLTPIDALPDEHGAVKAMVFTREGRTLRQRATRPRRCPRGRSSSPPGRRRTSPTRRRARARFQLDAKKKFFQPHAVVARCDRPSSPDAGRERLLHVVRRRRPVCELLRRQPSALCRQRREGHGVGERRLSSPRPTVRGGAGCAWTRRRRTRGTRRGRRWCAGSMAISTRTSKTWSGSRRPSSR